MSDDQTANPEAAAEQTVEVATSEAHVAEAAPIVVEDAPADPPVPLKAFALSLKKTADEVYTRLMANRHGSEKHTRSKWMKLLDSYRSETVYKVAR